MGKRVLLAWEVGGAEGHHVRLALIGERLRELGHVPIYALRRPSRNSSAVLDAAEVRQAPTWPGSVARTHRLPKRPASHADKLAELGMAEEGVCEAMLRSWDRLLAEIKPDAIVGDAAPACLSSAYGRIPTVAVGNGFSVPPPGLPKFPSLEPNGSASQADEHRLLSAVNDGLRATGRAPLAHLSDLYRADRASVGTFAELDPYTAARRTEVHAPSMPEWDIRTPAAREEIFGYFSLNTEGRYTVLYALALVAQGGLRVRVHISNVDAQTAEWLTANRVRVEPKPIPLAQVRSQARLLVSIGSLGFVSFGLAAAIPQIVVPCSAQTAFTGKVLENLGVGRSYEIEGVNPLEPVLLRQAIRDAFYDVALTKRAEERSPDFARRLHPRMEAKAAEFVAELI